MERITMSLDSVLAELFNDFIAEHSYTNRSEAMRDLIRQELEKGQLEKSGDGHCVATLSYVYNHHEHELASKITKVQHHHHELTLSTMHVHLDHDHCLEIAIMRGPVSIIKNSANAIMAERGIRHGKLNMVPIELSEISHTHEGHPHTHSRPLT